MAELQSPAHYWVEYTKTGGSPNGRITMAAGYANDLSATFGRLPVALCAQTAGLIVLKNRDGNEHAFTAVAGKDYALARPSDLDGTNTTADNILFYYNDPDATE